MKRPEFNLRRQVSMLLAIILLSSLLLKSFHHPSSHDSHNATVCEEHYTNHFHAGAEWKHCFLCEFLFSPYSDEIFRIAEKSQDAAFILKINGDVFRVVFPCALHYLLRAPPSPL